MIKSRSKTLFFLIFCLVALVAWALQDTPSQVDIAILSVGSDRILKDRNNEVIQVVRTDFLKRRLPWFENSNFPEHLKRLVLLSEDRRFFWHPGVDPLALLRALKRMASGSSTQGGSTLTMQLVDLTDPLVMTKGNRIKKGTLRGKLRQFVKAFLIELKWTKQEILEAYLNEIHLKGEFQGIPALGFAYFNKHPANLSEEESALIAAMISAPNQSQERLKTKACLLLSKFRNAPANCESFQPSLTQLFDIKPRMPRTPDNALHLARRLFSENKSVDRVTSTIDRKIQEKVSEILNRNLSTLSHKNVNNASAIVINNSTGEVLAYVGAATSGDQVSHVDGVTAFRQAGSTLKPFLYGRAFDMKLITPASVILDDATAISWSGGVYRPFNYDRNFHGPVSAREALASSLNVPAVKIVTIIGLHESYETIGKLGFKNLREPDFYGVSMALGAVDVQLETLANAYRMLANGGLWSPLVFEKKEDLKAVPGQEPPQRLYSEESAFQIQSILSDADARAIGFGWFSPLETPFYTAVKTGTSKDYRDNWCVGFSEKFTVAVWAGNFDSSAMNEVSGVSGAGPSWEEIMQTLHQNIPSRAPPMPSGLVEMKVRHPWSASERTEYFIKGTEPQNSQIEVAEEKQIQFVFPAEGSILVVDPHQSLERQALFVRFKGLIPKGAALYFNSTLLGPAVSPFKIEKLVKGSHSLSVRAANSPTALAKVNFEIR